ncbi:MULTISPECIES: hypothetical protein [Prochlorococcus]|nr:MULTISPECIES: hypothetical protein [Prochlorococcus]KGG12686.1 hypothetical protein EV05_1903 [Prochlorococcus sp. MIT 0601]
MNFNSRVQAPLTCELPRRKIAIEALLGILWKKEKKNRPAWMLNELNNY